MGTVIWIAIGAIVLLAFVVVLRRLARNVEPVRAGYVDGSTHVWVDKDLTPEQLRTLAHTLLGRAECDRIDHKMAHELTPAEYRFRYGRDPEGDAYPFAQATGLTWPEKERQRRRRRRQKRRNKLKAMKRGGRS